MVTTTRNGAVSEILNPVSNDAEEQIAFGEPYIADITIKGSSALLFHRWSNEAVEEKAKAAKGSKAKKSDDVESYVYRVPGTNEIGLPGEYLRMAIIYAAKFRQDPRSPRKSAFDLFKAGVISLTELAPIKVGHGEAGMGESRSAEAGYAKVWDYLDRRRVQVQRNAITRERPAFLAGWEAKFQMQVQVPEYISSDLLLDVLTQAGRLIGVGDFRPTYGRFQVTSFEVAAG